MPGGARYRRLGLCLACGKEREPGRFRCRPCLDKGQACNARKRALKIAEKRCVSCGKPNDLFPRVVCSTCKVKYRARRIALKMAAFSAYGGPFCACCGETIPDFLTIDHINNDGAAHRKKTEKDPTARMYRRPPSKEKPSGQGTGDCIYGWLKRNGYPPGFQVLCFNCNWSKARHLICPHKRANPNEPT